MRQRNSCWLPCAVNPPPDSSDGIIRDHGLELLADDACRPTTWTHLLAAEPRLQDALDATLHGPPPTGSVDDACRQFGARVRPLICRYIGCTAESPELQDDTYYAIAETELMRRWLDRLYATQLTSEADTITTCPEGAR